MPSCPRVQRENCEDQSAHCKTGFGVGAGFNRRANGSGNSLANAGEDIHQIQIRLVAVSLRKARRRAIFRSGTLV